MKSLTATLILQVPTSVADTVALDTGATAWGTLEGEMVRASACPATPAPATLSAYLQPTVDADHLDVLARLQVSTQAKAFIMDAVQRGYGVIVPEQMVTWEGGQTIAWWQLDLETGEMVGVGEDGTHIGTLLTEGFFWFAVVMITFVILWYIMRIFVWRLMADVTRATRYGWARKERSDETQNLNYLHSSIAAVDGYLPEK